MSDRKVLMIWLISLVVLQIVISCVLISRESEPATDSSTVTTRN